MNATIHAPATNASLTAAIAAAPAHLHPVLLAVRNQQAGMLFVGQDAGPFALPAKPKRAAIVIIGDDLLRSVGPDVFHLPSVRRIIRASCGFAVVSSAPTVDVYAALSAVAVGGGNALIVETRLEHEFQWVEMIRKLAPGRPLVVSTVKGGTA